MKKINKEQSKKVNAGTILPDLEGPKLPESITAAGKAPAGSAADRRRTLELNLGVDAEAIENNTPIEEPLSRTDELAAVLVKKMSEMEP